jgi:hypothetical protein
LDGEARDTHARWLEDDELEGVAEGLSASVDVVRSVLHAVRGCRQQSMNVGYAQRLMDCASLGCNHHSTGSASSTYSNSGSSGATSRVPLHMPIRFLRDDIVDETLRYVHVYMNINTIIEYYGGVIGG